MDTVNYWDRHHLVKAVIQVTLKLAAAATDAATVIDGSLVIAMTATASAHLKRTATEGRTRLRDRAAPTTESPQRNCVRNDSPWRQGVRPWTGPGAAALDAACPELTALPMGSMRAASATFCKQLQVFNSFACPYIFLCLAPECPELTVKTLSHCQSDAQLLLS